MNLKSLTRLLLFVSLFSCNTPKENNEAEKITTEIKNTQTSWKLQSTSLELQKPLGLFLKLTSDTLILNRTGETDSYKTFHECNLSFEAIRPIKSESLGNKLTEARKDIPSGLENTTEESMMDLLSKNYALLEITLLDSSKKIIEKSIITSSDFDSLTNLTNGRGKIKFQFKTQVTDENTKRIIASNPKYFSVSLSDKGIGICKVYREFIRNTKK
jgi:hypothetical protein